MNKIELRKKILKKRKKFYANYPTINLKKIFDIFKKKKLKNKIIGGYYPYNYEIDLLDNLKFFEKKNYFISLPKIEKNNQMNFYMWSFNEPLLINRYGIPEPISKKVVIPEILLIPLLAFDDDLNRLGYGGGYYDRYLGKFKKKNILKIGIAYSFQNLKKIPTNKHDVKLDFIITEKKIY